MATKGYVVRAVWKGKPAFVWHSSGLLSCGLAGDVPYLFEPDELGLVAEAHRRLVKIGCMNVKVLAVDEDGTETPIRSYQEALEEVERLTRELQEALAREARKDDMLARLDWAKVALTEALHGHPDAVKHAQEAQEQIAAHDDQAFPLVEIVRAMVTKGAIYLLEPKPGVRLTSDEVRLFVVRAQDERRARLLAGSKAGAEEDHFWFNDKRTSCSRLDIEAAPEVIVREVVS